MLKIADDSKTGGGTAGEDRGGAAVAVEHPFLGTLELLADVGPGEIAPTVLFCENESNTPRLFGCAPATPYPKDGINDHVVSGAATVNSGRIGTKCSFWYRLTVEPGGTAEIRLRLRPYGTAGATPAFGRNFDRTIANRKAEADEFYAALTPVGASADESLVMRQAFAGMLWGKQFYDYDVARWLDGDPAQPPAPPDRGLNRNARWRTFNAFDIMSMPDKWEYPWFAAWDLAFQCVALAHVDPGFAKYQLILLCREWFQHPNGALPAYEWDFSDVNPPVQAWAALEVFALDGGRDLDFLARIFDKLLVNFTWWVNREDIWGNNLFEGGFFGLDNIGPIDRSHLPPGTVLEQSDATGWMAFYALSMAVIASDPLAQRPPPGRRPRAQVPRALRRHRGGSRTSGHVGRGRRDVLRPPVPGQRRGHPGQGALHGRDDPAARDGHRRRGDDAQRDEVRQAVRGLPRPAGLRRRSQAQRAGPAARRRRRRRAVAAQRGRRRSGSLSCSGRCSTSREFLSAVRARGR